MTALTDSHIFVGDSSNQAADVAMTGDVTIDDTGATTIKTNVALAGNPTTTTQSAGDNSTKIATTAYVDNGLSTLSLGDLTNNYVVNGNIILESPGTAGSITSASGNIGIGPFTFVNITSGIDNLGLGRSALKQMSTGNHNIALGTAALQGSDGSNNVAVGFNATRNVTSGDGNVAVGYNTGLTLTNGSDNILIGDGVDVPSATTNNYIAIGDAITGDHLALNIAGDPTTTTQSPGDNSTKIATTAYVAAAVSAAGGTANAWCTYDQSTSTIIGSRNVSSVTNNATGQYTVNLSTSTSNANYVIVGTMGNGAATSVILSPITSVTSTSSYKVTTRYAPNNTAQSGISYTAIFDN